MTLGEDEVNRTAQRLAPPKWDESAKLLKVDPGQKLINSADIRVSLFGRPR
jgi:hypothetical protein